MVEVVKLSVNNIMFVAHEEVELNAKLDEMNKDLVSNVQ